LEDKQERLELLLELDRLKIAKAQRVKRRKIRQYYPDKGPLRRELYPKHMAFFEAGIKHRERAMMAANRIGKTEGVGGYELALHLTGDYPEWWKGRRFDEAITAWAAGTTNQTTKDILQTKLVGPMTDVGTGLIPGDAIVDYKRKASSVPDTLETVFVRHVSGGTSILGFKSYEQGRKAFEGVEQKVILLDEEAPEDIYDECLIRTMTVKGLIMLTFTPLNGLSNTVMKFMPGGKVIDPGENGKFLIQATWDDAPHLSEEDKAEILRELPPHQRDSRSKGIPSLGSGAIYPISEDDLLIDDFNFPAYWPRAYGFDFGWKNTAAVWGARNPENDTWYLYSCYKKGHSEPPVHAQAIKLRGEWIRGVCDPAGRISSQDDGTKLMDKYSDLGLRIQKADNAVEAGIFEVWKRMTSGRLKVFKSMQDWLAEFRIYRRDDKGKVIKDFDHYMDCTRYLMMSGKSVERIAPLDVLAKNIGMFNQEDNYNPLAFGL
jgi:phage terminase large subunit-like protein